MRRGSLLPRGHLRWYRSHWHFGTACRQFDLSHRSLSREDFCRQFRLTLDRVFRFCLFRSRKIHHDPFRNPPRECLSPFRPDL